MTKTKNKKIKTKKNVILVGAKGETRLTIINRKEKTGGHRWALGEEGGFARFFKLNVHKKKIIIIKNLSAEKKKMKKTNFNQLNNYNLIVTFPFLVVSAQSTSAARAHSM